MVLRFCHESEFTHSNIVDRHIQGVSKSRATRKVVHHSSVLVSATSSPILS